ncbi:Polyketide cyclase / dehydrase and lipid transport [Actinomadura rubteroloni]|uniref:Polyketide cyclase / dehydrase and lipid transport n=1 Tax=Actinomadura rubteroloni TaxID=1926885 RepID=A0A2P4UJM1_9ACTN|nr:SRPBCC family protein [Actinomadura rubteroloni]POM25253.1 Polyketide cyclase / dehydrase and lipid transport [Actinomadura rubteroloni]
MTLTFETSAMSTAPAAEIFKHLAVAAAWNSWGRFPTKVHRTRAGDGTGNGVGAVRKVLLVRERVVTFDPPSHYGYVALAGLPLRNYRSDVYLEPRAGNTRIRWTAEFEPKVPGTGPVAQLVVDRMLTSFVRRLARHVEHCPANCPARDPEAI